MSHGALLLYAVLPYLAIATFVVGTWWRYRYDQYGWGARSSQFLESRDQSFRRIPPAEGSEASALIGDRLHNGSV